LKQVESHTWTQPVRFAMLHHPISPMPAPIEIARFGGLLNAGAAKTSFLRACLKSPHPSPTAGFRIRHPPFNPGTRDDPICPEADPHKGTRDRPSRVVSGHSSKLCRR
jgi:hypothetical protein